MSKKLTVGKLLGIIFCILAAVCTVVLLCINAYLGGQMKVIDKYFTSLERDDFEGFKACVGETKAVPGYAVGSNALLVAAQITEEDFAKAKSEIAVLPDNEKNRVKASFVGRRNIVSTYKEYWVTVDLTVYNDSSHEIINDVYLHVTREKGKWLIEPYTFDWYACVFDPDYSALYQIYSESIQ